MACELLVPVDVVRYVDSHLRRGWSRISDPEGGHRFAQLPGLSIH
jgi:hypothetical protein